MEVVLYDKDINYLTTYKNPISFQWTEAYMEKGSFQVVFSRTSVNFDVIKKTKYIITKTDPYIYVYQPKFGFVLSVTIDEENSVVVLKGDNGENWYEKAMMVENWGYTEPTEITKIARGFVEGAMGDSEDPNDNPYFKSWSGDKPAPTLDVFVPEEGTSIYKIVRDVLNPYGWSFRTFILPEVKEIWFEPYIGVDRTAGQNTNEKVILSTNRFNVYNETYTRSEANYRNRAYISGTNKSGTKVLVDVNQRKSGEVAREVYQQSGVNPDQVANDSQYNSMLQNEGIALLETMKIEESITFEVLEQNLTTVPNLGDIVTYYYADLDIEINDRVTKAETIVEEGVFAYKLTVGREGKVYA